MKNLGRTIKSTLENNRAAMMRRRRRRLKDTTMFAPAVAARMKHHASCPC